MHYQNSRFHNIEEFYEAIRELRGRLFKKLEEDVVETNGEEMSAYTALEAIKKANAPYGEMFNNNMTKLQYEINRKVRFSSFFKNDVPFIGLMNPTVEEDGNYYIDLVLINSQGRYIGTGIIDYSGDIKLDVRDGYNGDKLVTIMNKYYREFLNYLALLGRFNNQYPETFCEWNLSNVDSYGVNANNINQEISDGFLKVIVNIDHIKSPFLTFSNFDDFELSRTRSKKYGELFDYLEFDKNSYLKRMKVNVSDFNKLYQTLIRTELNLEKPKELKRVE